MCATYGYAAAQASLAKTFLASDWGNVIEKGNGCGSLCLEQNSAGVTPWNCSTSGRSCLEATSTHGMSLSM